MIRLLIYTCSVLFVIGCYSKSGSTIPIQRGYFKATLTESGELQAVNSRMINMPDYNPRYGEAKILAMQDEGTQVKKGDYVAQIDTSNVVRILTETVSNLAIAQADYQKLLIEQESEMRQLESELRSVKAALALAVVDTQSVLFEPKSKRERSRLEYLRSAIDVSKLESKLKYTRQIQREDKTILEAKIKNNIREIQNARRTIDRFTITAPADGMIEYRRRGRSRRKISIGEEFWPGEPIIGLPDLSQMKAAIMVNETDIEKIELGQPASVRLDAFPQEAFPGKIVTISRMCRYKDRDNQDIKVFDVEVLLEETNIILRPGMTVSCEITIAEFEDVFHIPVEYVQETAGGYQILVKRGSKEKEIKVKLGARNAKEVVVYGDLLQDDRLAYPQEREKAA
jgi:HlyD family secretion protein